IAVDVDHVEDVLAIREDRLPVDVAQRIGPHRESWCTPRSDIAPRAHMRVAGLAEQVGQRVAIEVDEAIPLPDVEILVPVGAPGPAISGAFVERDLPGPFLHEQVEIAVAIDIDEL